MQALSGGLVADIPRHVRIAQFECQGCKHEVKNAYCIPYPTKRKQSRTTVTIDGKQVRKIKWLCRAGKGFCCLACMVCYGKSRRWMYPKQTADVVTLMIMEAYGYLGDVPIAQPHWKLPPFCMTKHPADAGWTIEKYRESLHVPFTPPNPLIHEFQDEPSYMVVDVDMTALPKDVSIRDLLAKFQAEFPQLLYKSDYIDFE